MPRYDYATVGHVTVDVSVTGERRPGGGALYSALQAASLGLRTLIVTQGVRSEIEHLLSPYLDELDLIVADAPATTTLLTIGAGEGRRQSVKAWAGPIATIPPPAANIVHLAPVARETPRGWQPEAPFVGVSPQGLIRSWPEEGGPIVPARLDRADLPPRFDAATINASELDCCAPLLSAASDSGATLAITASSAPTRVLSGTDEMTVPVVPVPAPVDDVGAGDVFAAAFFVALASGETAERAALLGNAAAAVRIAGVGLQAIGDAKAIGDVSERHGASSVAGGQAG